MKFTYKNTAKSKTRSDNNNWELPSFWISWSNELMFRIWLKHLIYQLSVICWQNSRESWTMKMLPTMYPEEIYSVKSRQYWVKLFSMMCTGNIGQFWGKTKHLECKGQLRLSKKTWFDSRIMQFLKHLMKFYSKKDYTKTKENLYLGRIILELQGKLQLVKKVLSYFNKQDKELLSGQLLALDPNMPPYHLLQRRLRTSLEKKLCNHHSKRVKRTGRTNIDKKSLDNWWLRISKRPTSFGQTMKWKMLK